MDPLVERSNHHIVEGGGDGVRKEMQLFQWDSSHGFKEIVVI